MGLPFGDLFIPLIIVVSFGLPLLIVAVVFMVIGQANRRYRELLETGEPATGRVISVRYTGTRINGNPQVEVQLEVARPGFPPYEARCRFLVGFGMIGAPFGPGMSVGVRVDPADPKRVAILGTGGVVQPGAGMGQPPGGGPSLGPTQVLGGATGVATSQTVVYNGRTYASVEELPPEARAMFQQAAGLLGDADGNGVPDMLERPGAQLQSMGGATTSPAERLRELKGLFDQGLITAEEYERKRGEILSRM